MRNLILILATIGLTACGKSSGENSADASTQPSTSCAPIEGTWTSRAYLNEDPMFHVPHTLNIDAACQFTDTNGLAGRLGFGDEDRIRVTSPNASLAIGNYFCTMSLIETTTPHRFDLRCYNENSGVLLYSALFNR